MNKYNLPPASKHPQSHTQDIADRYYPCQINKPHRSVKSCIRNCHGLAFTPFCDTCKSSIVKSCIRNCHGLVSLYKMLAVTGWQSLRYAAQCARCHKLLVSESLALPYSGLSYTPC